METKTFGTNQTMFVSEATYMGQKYWVQQDSRDGRYDQSCGHNLDRIDHFGDPTEWLICIQCDGLALDTTY